MEETKGGGRTIDLFLIMCSLKERERDKELESICRHEKGLSNIHPRCCDNGAHIPMTLPRTNGDPVQGDDVRSDAPRPLCCLSLLSRTRNKLSMHF